jgi:starch synthase
VRDGECLARTDGGRPSARYRQWNRRELDIADRHTQGSYGGCAVWKEHNAAAIRDAFDLAPTHGPLFSIISRLVHQKGIDLSIEAAETIVGAGGQIAVTGRGDPKLEGAIVDLSKRYPGSVGVHIGFDDVEAHKMFAASDFLLMPSRFEPCGLSQMYAQRCGTLPIACRTGGLADTMEDDRSGFLFSAPSVRELTSALRSGI